MSETKVKSATLYYQEKDKWFIDVTYICEDEKVVKEINIPKLEIPLLKYGRFDVETVYINEWPTNLLGKSRAINIGEARLWMHKDENGCEYYEKIIKEKTQEMTLDEIEKKLGYKIKIVSKK